MTFADCIIKFNRRLHLPVSLPGVEVMNPFKNKATLELSETFYKQFYNDNHIRTFIFGINPGRFGAGVTGIPFTDPMRLEKECGIKNDLKKLPELSSLFVYRFIEAYGGVTKFYRNFFITALCPLGFIAHGKNMNYYDDKKLYLQVKDFMAGSVKKQLLFGANRELAFCLGEGTNYKYFLQLNEEHDFFKKIIPLPHPRWIMQYRRKRADEFVEKYINAFES